MIAKTEKFDRRSLSGFMVQWHITARCDQRCKHCYMVNNKQTYKDELKKELSLSQCKSVIDSLVEFCKTAKAYPAINFTGGDPLLRPDFLEVLEYAFSKDVVMRIMGNPFHLDSAKIRQLKELNIRSFQMSLDGMEEIHDFLRRPGSFSATLDGIRLLKEHGMRTVIMFTLSKKNAKDIMKVMSLANDSSVDVFTFARLTMNLTDGEYFSREEVDIHPFDYRELLLKIQQHARGLRLRGSKTFFSKKDHLWKLLLFEQNKLNLKPNPRNQVVSGCHIGRSNLTVLADGTVFACRRFFSPIGKVPDQSVLEIFTSRELDFYRQIEKFEKCSDCPLLCYCRGCPAVAYGFSDGNFYAPDPQCWRSLS